MSNRYRDFDEDFNEIEPLVRIDRTKFKKSETKVKKMKGDGDRSQKRKGSNGDSRNTRF